MEGVVNSHKSPAKKRKRTPSEKAAASGAHYGAAPSAAEPASAAASLVTQLPVRPPTSAQARRLALLPTDSPPPSAAAGGGAGGSAPRVVHSAAPHALLPRAWMGDGSADTPMRFEYDTSDPLEFFTSQGVARQLALAALAACNNDPDRAQVWIMTHGVTAPAPRPAGRPSGAGGLAAAAALARAAGGAHAGGHAVGSGGESDEEAAEAAFQRDLERAQLASEALSKQEERTREAAFVESARAAPIETFEDTSFFLATVRGKGGPTGFVPPPGGATLSDAELRALVQPLAEMLLLERQALRAYAQQVVPYFRRTAALLAATPGGGDTRLKWLQERVREVGDPSRAGSMNGMPVRGRAGGLPAVFDGDDDGALVLSDSDIVVLD